MDFTTALSLYNFSAFIQNRKKPHWEETISAIESARKLAMHHSDVIGGRGGEMTSLVIKQCQNGRSRVARSALEAVRDLFRFLRKSLLGQLDAAVKVLLGLFSFKTDFSAFKSGLYGRTSSTYPAVHLHEIGIDL